MFTSYEVFPGLKYHKPFTVVCMQHQLQIWKYDEYLNVTVCKKMYFYLHSDFETIQVQLIYYRNILLIRGPVLWERYFNKIFIIFQQEKQKQVLKKVCVNEKYMHRETRYTYKWNIAFFHCCLHVAWTNGFYWKSYIQYV